MAFRGLQAETVAQGESHRVIAKELTELVADPFDEWAAGHKVRVAPFAAYITRTLSQLYIQDRIYSSRNAVIDGWLKSYELAQGDVRVPV